MVVELNPTRVATVIIPDTSYLSTLDCFHPSLLAHQKFAISIWNRFSPYTSHLLQFELTRAFLFTVHTHHQSGDAVGQEEASFQPQRRSPVPRRQHSPVHRLRLKTKPANNNILVFSAQRHL